jgi:uncharacterized membrane protein YkvA (DUF1232 family)
MTHSASLLARLRIWAKAIRRDTLTLWLAARDPRTPRRARLLCAAIAAYALSPIDLIPDAIPILGLLDEAILLPLAMLFVIRLIPPQLLLELRDEAARRADRPVSRAGALIVIALWALTASFVAWLLWRA